MKRVLKEFEVFPVICTVQSFPLSKLTVTGPKDFQNNQVNITESVNNLTIYLNVTESHAGKYKCKAENSEGQVETNQEELTVLCKYNQLKYLQVFEILQALEEH